MGRVVRLSTVGGPEPDPVATSQQLDEVTRVLEEVEFGDPQDPNDPASTTLAGDFSAASGHNGTLQNIAGSWVEVALEATGLTIATCTHNLYLGNDQATVPVTGQPNCRWLVFGVQHDGTGAETPPVGGTRIGVDVSFVGDTVAVNAIDLRFDLRVSGLTPTIGAANPVLVTLFFTKATRGE